MTADSRRRLLYPLGLGALAVVVYAIPQAGERLEYDRVAVFSGEVWRLVTGHWTHGSAAHLVWDVLAFVVLGCVTVVSAPRQFTPIVGLTAIAISAYLLLTPQWLQYRGLSGIDSALFVGLATAVWRDPAKPRGRHVAAAAVALFLLKVGYEAWSGAALFASDTPGYQVMPSAHLIGALVGAGTAWRLGGRA